MKKQYTCPHCGRAMDPIETPLDSTWGGEIHYVCFNDECPYFKESWDLLDQQGVLRTGYRCRIDARGTCGPLAVWSVDALKDMILVNDSEETEEKRTLDYFEAEDFARDDESDDETFYNEFPFLVQMDHLALTTLEDLYVRLIPKGSRILDLMAGPDSHLRDSIAPESVVGLGLNRVEVEQNEALTARVIHDLNTEPRLPFGDDEFDAVISTSSIEYLTRPLEVFREVARVLKPGGIFIVVFSNRMFPPKTVNIWKKTNESERVELVKKYFALANGFSTAGSFESTGKPRPEDDQYYSLGIPSDPIYALWGTVQK